jgi:hypothetical protein
VFKVPGQLRLRAASLSTAVRCALLLWHMTHTHDICIFCSIFRHETQSQMHFAYIYIILLIRLSKLKSIFRIGIGIGIGIKIQDVLCAQTPNGTLLHKPHTEALSFAHEWLQLGFSPGV